jgi:hypothetical protein
MYIEEESEESERGFVQCMYHGVAIKNNIIQISRRFLLKFLEFPESLAFAVIIQQLRAFHPIAVDDVAPILRGPSSFHI